MWFDKISLLEIHFTCYSFWHRSCHLFSPSPLVYHFSVYRIPFLHTFTAALEPCRLPPGRAQTLAFFFFGLPAATGAGVLNTVLWANKHKNKDTNTCFSDTFPSGKVSKRHRSKNFCCCLGTYWHVVHIGLNLQKTIETKAKTIKI